MSRRNRPIRMVVATVLTAIAVGVPAGAQAQTNNEPQYVPGSAVAFKPVWDYASETWSWKCTYAGWAVVGKSWDCRLKNIYGTTVSIHDGSFSNSGFHTALWFYRKSLSTRLCTVAYAAYDNGSSSDSSTACN